MTGKKHICVTVEKSETMTFSSLEFRLRCFRQQHRRRVLPHLPKCPPLLALDWVSSLRKAAGGGRGEGKGEKKKRPSLSHRGDRRQSEKRKREDEEATFFSLLVKS